MHGTQEQINAIISYLEEAECGARMMDDVETANRIARAVVVMNTPSDVKVFADEFISGYCEPKPVTKMSHEEKIEMYQRIMYKYVHEQTHDIKEIIRVLGFIQEYFGNHAEEQEPIARKEMFMNWSEIVLDAIMLLKAKQQ